MWDFVEFCSGYYIRHPNVTKAHQHLGVQSHKPQVFFESLLPTCSKSPLKTWKRHEKTIGPRFVKAIVTSPVYRGRQAHFMLRHPDIQHLQAAVRPIRGLSPRRFQLSQLLLISSMHSNTWKCIKLCAARVRNGQNNKGVSQIHFCSSVITVSELILARIGIRESKSRSLKHDSADIGRSALANLCKQRVNTSWLNQTNLMLSVVKTWLVFCSLGQALQEASCDTRCRSLKLETASQLLILGYLTDWLPMLGTLGDVWTSWGILERVKDLSALRSGLELLQEYLEFLRLLSLWFQRRFTNKGPNQLPWSPQNSYCF